MLTRAITTVVWAARVAGTQLLRVNVMAAIDIVQEAMVVPPDLKDARDTPDAVGKSLGKTILI